MQNEELSERSEKIDTKVGKSNNGSQKGRIDNTELQLPEHMGRMENKNNIVRNKKRYPRVG